AYHGVIGVVVGDIAPQAASAHARVEDLGVDSILIELAESLLGRAGPGLQVVGHRPVRTPLLESEAGVVLVQLEQGVTLGKNCVPAIGEPNCSRGPVPEALGHAVTPAVWTDFEMRVGGDLAVRLPHVATPDFVRKVTFVSAVATATDP